MVKYDTIAYIYIVIAFGICLHIMKDSTQLHEIIRNKLFLSLNVIIALTYVYLNNRPPENIDDIEQYERLRSSMRIGMFAYIVGIMHYLQMTLGIFFIIVPLYYLTGDTIFAIK